MGTVGSGEKIRRNVNVNVNIYITSYITTTEAYLTGKLPILQC